MENNTKPDSEETKSAAVATSADQNPAIDNNSQSPAVEEQPGSDVIENGTRQPSSTRTPFTNLSQVDADLALARTLQEQERAYMMLRLNGNGGGYGGWEAGGYVLEDGEDFDLSDDEYDGLDAEVEEGEEGEEDIDDDEDDDDDDDDEEDEEDAFDVHAHAEDGEDSELSDSVDLDPASFPNDEAYARALQDAEDREMAARLLALAGLNDRADASEAEDMEDHGDNSQDTWEEVDPDELSYEELIALGEIVGTESRGLSADSIASLPSVSYKMQSAQDGNNDSCVICRLDYEDEDTLTVLSCKHSYHSECLHNWLRINKVCPVCSAEVPSASGNS